MMFRFNIFNHCEDGRRCIEDLTTIMSAQLRDLGHEAVSANDGYITGEAGINVLYESFADEGTISTIAAAYADGARFLYIATEEPTAAGCFNGRLDNAMDARMAVFPEAARYAEGILHLTPGSEVTEWYSRYAPAAYAEIGHASSLVHENGPDDVVPLHTFGFYGQMTPRRERIFGRLARVSGYEVVVLPFITHSSTERDVAMRSVRVILQVRAHDSMPIVSSSRCATALHLGRPVVGEPHAAPGPWGKIVHLSSTLDDFYNDAILASAEWSELHLRQLKQFAATLPPEVCLGDPLRRIGIL